MLGEGMDPKLLREMLLIGVDLIIRKAMEPPVRPLQQHKVLIQEFAKDGKELDLTPPPDDGKGPWTLASWRPEFYESHAVYTHWTRTVSEPVPPYVMGEAAEPLPTAGPTDEAADEPKPPSQ